jgi:hypothetical protein
VQGKKQPKPRLHPGERCDLRFRACIMSSSSVLLVAVARPGDRVLVALHVNPGATAGEIPDSCVQSVQRVVAAPIVAHIPMNRRSLLASLLFRSGLNQQGTACVSALELHPQGSLCVGISGKVLCMRVCMCNLPQVDGEPGRRAAPASAARPGGLRPARCHHLRRASALSAGQQHQERLAAG